MPVNGIIQELLENLEKEVFQLKSKQNISEKKYIDDWEIQHIVERGLQESVQICIDIGARIISQKSFSKPKDYHNIFEILKEEKIIDEHLEIKMKELVGLRNALTHEYRHINHKEVYRHFQHTLEKFIEFAKVIINLIQK